eukprot:m.1588303 g.1588303  ORF g.1588303 m.1588303 type:complete len:194 (+) comp25331_c2_seq16:233-814(+)
MVVATVDEVAAEEKGCVECQPDRTGKEFVTILWNDDVTTYDEVTFRLSQVVGGQLFHHAVKQLVKAAHELGRANVYFGSFEDCSTKADVCRLYLVAFAPRKPVTIFAMVTIPQPQALREGARPLTTTMSTVTRLVNTDICIVIVNVLRHFSDMHPEFRSALSDFVVNTYVKHVPNCSCSGIVSLCQSSLEFLF